MSKHKKAKPALKPEALAWLAEKMSPTEWSRVLDLHRMSIEALFVYVRSLCNDELYREFMDLNEPELAAERKKKEAEAAEAARRESDDSYGREGHAEPIRQSSGGQFRTAMERRRSDRSRADRSREGSRRGKDRNAANSRPVMIRPFFHSPPTRWSELYAGWLAYAEATNHERKNGWRKLSPLERVLSGIESASSPK